MRRQDGRRVRPGQPSSIPSPGGLGAAPSAGRRMVAADFAPQAAQAGISAVADDSGQNGTRSKPAGVVAPPCGATSGAARAPRNFVPGFIPVDGAERLTVSRETSLRRRQWRSGREGTAPQHRRMPCRSATLCRSGAPLSPYRPVCLVNRRGSRTRISAARGRRCGGGGGAGRKIMAKASLGQDAGRVGSANWELA